MKEGIYGKCSEGQTFSNTTSTGEVSSNVFDLETNSGITDDQSVGFMNVTVISAPAQASIAGTQGLIVEVRTAALEALASLYEIGGAVSVLPSKLIAGFRFSVPFNLDVCQKHIGAWVRAVNTSFVGDIVLDIDFSNEPVSPANEDTQKIVS